MIAWVMGLSILTLVSLAQLVDFGGFRSATSEQSRIIIQRAVAPWWGWADSAWHLPGTEQMATVVLIAQRGSELWPPQYEVQTKTIASVAAYCPHVIAIDIVYDTDRMRDAVLSQELRNVEKAAAECPTPPILIFADKLTQRPGDGLIDPAYLFIGGPCGELSRDDNCGTYVPRTLAPIYYDETEDDPSSPYFGMSNVDFYRPILRSNAFSHGTNGRMNLGLMAYLALCATPRPNLDPKACPADLKDEIAARFGLKAGGIPASAPVSDTLAAQFAAPVDILWPRWAPTESRIYQSRACTADADMGMLTRAGESARLLFASLRGSSVAAQEQTTVACFPLTTLFARPHIMRDDCRFLEGTNKGICEEQHHPLRGMVKDLKGRVVFIGFQNPNDKDETVSPVQGRMPGVMRHAMAFDNLLRLGDNYIRPPQPNAFTLLGHQVGWAVLIEIAVLWVVSLSAIGVMRLDRVKDAIIRLTPAWAALSREMPRTAREAARDRCVFILITRVLPVVALFTVSLTVSAMLSLAFKWSISNWINAGILSSGTFFLSEYVARLSTSHSEPSTSREEVSL